MQTRSLLRRVGPLAPLALAALLAGCHASNDEEVYQSTVGRPTTVQVQDAFTHAVLWSKDVPPECSLEVDFLHENGTRYLKTDPHPPIGFNWALNSPGGEDLETGDMDLPGTPVIVAQVIRPRPEYPALPAAPAMTVMPSAPAAPPASPAPAASATLNISLSGTEGISVGSHQLDFDGLRDLVGNWGKQYPAGSVVITTAPDAAARLINRVKSICQVGVPGSITVVTPVAPGATTPAAAAAPAMPPMPAAPAPQPAAGPAAAAPMPAPRPAPAAAAATTATKLGPATVALSGVGRISIGQQQYNLYDFENLVDGWSQADRTRPIIIAPESGSSPALLKDVVNVCRDYGMSNIVIAPATKP
jgi:biopolymer transport protein ExbD